MPWRVLIAISVTGNDDGDAMYTCYLLDIEVLKRRGVDLAVVILELNIASLPVDEDALGLVVSVRVMMSNELGYAGRVSPV